VLEDIPGLTSKRIKSRDLVFPVSSFYPNARTVISH